MILGSLIASTTFLFLREHPLDWAFLLPGQIFLWTGLFITAHDAMHGLIAPKYPKLNHAIGMLSTFLYAAFPYGKLKTAHMKHHEAPGDPTVDPDFHDGEHDNFFRWYFRFVGHYIGVVQIVIMAVVFNVLEHLVGISVWNLLMFWVAPAILSTFQLFFFGTYLPHRKAEGPEDPHHARSNPYPPWLSFLTCYHFGYHREHHEWPYVPWWRLPAARKLSQEK